MRRYACLTAVVSLACVSTDASTLRIYFSTTGLGPGGMLNAPPPEYAPQRNAAGDFPLGLPLYLYAAVEDTGTWNNISLEYSGMFGPVTLVNSQFLGLSRWNGISDFTGDLSGSDSTYLLAVNEFGIPNPDPLGPFDNLECPGPGAVEQFYLGSVQYNGGLREF